MVMMSDKLCREVERLVNAPYAPSLQDLYTLTQQLSSTVVCFWVSQKPCQVAPLVDVLVDGLTRSRFALPLLAYFALAQEFRDTLLQRYPYLLDQFLRQSTEGSEAKCLSACLSLLSSALPWGMIPPASLAPFVMQMIERMRVNPCAETIRPLYLVSNCLQASGVLFELPLEVMTCFQTELTKTLRNLEDHMGNLLCLATFARLGSCRSWDAETENGADAPTWLQNIRHFFGPKRGLKTLDLVVLRVILACSSNYGNLTVQQSAESIRLAISICDGVDKAQGVCWIEGNSIKLAKLLEKVTRDGIDHSVQMLGVSFLSSLVPAASLPHELKRASLELILSNNALAIMEALPTHIITRLVGAWATSSDEYGLEEVLHYITSTLSARATDTVDLTKLRISKLALDGLRFSDVQVADTVSEKYGPTIYNLMESFPRRPAVLDCSGDIVCSASVSGLENDLLSDLISFWFEATMPRNAQDQSFPLGAAGLITFVTRRNKLLLPEPKCTSSQAKPLEFRTTMRSFKTNETADVSRNDWRTGMRDIMAANTQMANDSIARKIEDICYDLEQRCRNIEAPLRAAEEERDKYRLEAEQLKERNHDLESQLQQASGTIAEFREEMSGLEEHANSSTHRADELSASLTRAQNDLQELQRTLQDTISNERELSRTRELGIIASLTEKDERLDELQEEIKRQTEMNEDLRTKLTSASKDNASSLDEIAAVKYEALTLQTYLEQEKASLAQKDTLIEQLMNEKESADNLTNELEKKLHEQASETESLRDTLHDTTEKLRTELEEFRRNSDIQSSRMAEEAAEQKSEFISLQRAMQEVKSEATRELQTKGKRVQHLERKVQHLREERAAKAREFSEAQQHISRLMSVMGFKPPSSDNRTSSKQRPRPSLEQLQTATVQTDSACALSPIRDNDPSTSFTTPQPVARTPKRPRNNAFPSGQPSPSRSLESRKKSRESTLGASPPKHQVRTPLGETSHNSQLDSQTTEKLSCSRHDYDRQINTQAGQKHLDDIELDLDLEFSKDFVFTSTSLSEMNGHGRV